MRQVPDNLVNFCNKRSLKHFRSRQQCQVLRDSRDEPDHVALRVDGRGASVEEAAKSFPGKLPSPTKNWLICSAQLSSCICSIFMKNLE
jgi:hypothetical protein